LERVRLRVAQFLATDATPKSRVVEELWRQIEAIWSTQAYRDAGEEPCKLQARLAMVSFLIGDIFFFSCKSGKDRSGLLDVETKFLAHRLAPLLDSAEPDTSVEVPDYDTHLTPELTASYRALCFRAGNWKVQEYNNGAPGFRVAKTGHAGFVRRIGGETAWRLLTGLAPYVDSGALD
jgi:phosphatidylinositol-4,5-bisphosphate 4-phosphatase